jgi:hypothetical protein
MLRTSRSDRHDDCVREFLPRGRFRLFGGRSSWRAQKLDEILLKAKELARDDGRPWLWGAEVGDQRRFAGPHRG